MKQIINLPRYRFGLGSISIRRKYPFSVLFKILLRVRSQVYIFLRDASAGKHFSASKILFSDTKQNATLTI